MGLREGEEESPGVGPFSEISKRPSRPIGFKGGTSRVEEGQEEGKEPEEKGGEETSEESGERKKPKKERKEGAKPPFKVPPLP
jgi:hypothetical protein